MANKEIHFIAIIEQSRAGDMGEILKTAESFQLKIAKVRTSNRNLLEYNVAAGDVVIELFGVGNYNSGDFLNSMKKFNITIEQCSPDKITVNIILLLLIRIHYLPYIFY